MAIIVAGLERCGLPMTKRRRSRRDDNKTGKTCITIILIAFMAVMSVQIHKVYQKDLEKIAQEEIRKKEIAARYDEEIKLISSNLNAGVVNTNVSPMNAGVAAGAFACPKCGVAVGNDDVFCQNCGNKLR